MNLNCYIRFLTCFKTSRRSSKQARLPGWPTCFRVFPTPFVSGFVTNQTYSLKRSTTVRFVIYSFSLGPTHPILYQVMPLYISSLDRLRLVQPSISLLHQLDTYFCSAFSRMPPPALGPMAFKSFWDFLRNGIGSNQLKTSCPESIRICLTAFYDACGDELPCELTSESQSHSQISHVSFLLMHKRGSCQTHL